MNLAAALGCGVATSSAEAAYYAAHLLASEDPAPWQSLSKELRQKWELVALAVANRALRELQAAANQGLTSALKQACQCRDCTARRSLQS